MRLPSGSVLGLGLAATVAALAGLVRRRRRQHRIPGDPTASQRIRPPLPAVAEAIEAAWLATPRTRGPEGPDEDWSVGDYFEDGEEDGDDDADPGVTSAFAGGAEGGGRCDPVQASAGQDLGDTHDGIEVDNADRHAAASAAGAAAGGSGETPLAASAASAAVDTVSGPTRSVDRPRGHTIGGKPAPTLLALIGPPTAAALAQAAWSGGVGLVGPGAAGAARAVLARLLTATGPMDGMLLTTEETVAELLPAGAVEAFASVPGVTVFPTLAAALTTAESELLGRNRRLDDTGTDTLTAYRQLPDGEPVPAVLLFAHAPGTAGLTARAAASLDLGRDRELGAVWLGAWPPATLTVSTTGALTFADPGSFAGQTEDPAGQTENLLPADTADLLTALLPGVRGALDVLSPSILSPCTDDEAAGVDADSDAAAPAPAVELPAGGAGDPWAPRRGAALEVDVLGRVRVTVVDGAEVTSLRAKVRELLAVLAVHPDGLSTDQISEALWPEAPPGRASTRLSPLLAQTRRLLREAAHLTDDPTTVPAADPAHHPGSPSASPVDLVPLTDGRYRLHPVLLDTDYRRFTAALAAAADARTSNTDKADDGAAYRAALQAAAHLYRGEPFDGAGYGWAEPIRETLRRQATDALAALAEALTPDRDNDRDHADRNNADRSVDRGGRSAGQSGWPQAGRDEALAALERAIEVDPYNEELYRRIMRLHAGAGRRDAVRRTLRLLEARLLDLDTDPAPATLTLATDLLRSGSTRPARTLPARSASKSSVHQPRR